jgi:hypothetical protein
MKLALEFMGMSPDLNHVNSALELLDLADEENGGLALDSYHFFAGSSTLKDLEKVPVSRISSVHLADGSADLSDPFLEFDRMMPGEGELPLGDFIRVLTDTDFEGFWRVECIQGGDYASDLKEVAARALGLIRSLVGEPRVPIRQNRMRYVNRRLGLAPGRMLLFEFPYDRIEQLVDREVLLPLLAPVPVLQVIVGPRKPLLHGH